MPSTSSLTGIALSPVWHSIGSWSYGTGPIGSPGNWLQELSTSAWALCGGSSTKLPIAACSVRISRLAFAASKGVKKLGVRLGNWLTVEQAHSLWQAPDRQGLKGKRDRALLALLLACGLRRHEAVGLRIDDLQQREEHWAIVDLLGKAGHVRTVPIPDWVKGQLDEWLEAAGIARGRIFRRVTRMGRTWGDCMTEKSIWLSPDHQRCIDSHPRFLLPVPMLRSVLREKFILGLEHLHRNGGLDCRSPAAASRIGNYLPCVTGSIEAEEVGRGKRKQARSRPLCDCFFSSATPANRFVLRFRRREAGPEEP